MPMNILIYTFIVMSENINGEKLQMGVDPRCLVLSRGKGKVAPKTAAEIFKFAFQDLKP